MLEISMEKKSKKAFKDLLRALKKRDAVKKMLSGLAQESANQMHKTVAERLEKSGAAALGKKLEYVYTEDGQVGIALLPKRKKMGVSDFTPDQAVWFIPSESNSNESRVVMAASRHNPWYGPLVPILPAAGEGSVVVREVREAESRKLKVTSEKARVEIQTMMRSEGVTKSASVKVRVYVDVGFSAARAEFGGGDSGDGKGIWRKTIREVEKGLPPGVTTKIENVLLNGNGWLLTKGIGSRKIDSAEEDKIREFQSSV